MGRARFEQKIVGRDGHKQTNGSQERVLVIMTNSCLPFHTSDENSTALCRVTGLAWVATAVRWWAITTPTMTSAKAKAKTPPITARNGNASAVRVPAALPPSGLTARTWPPSVAPETKEEHTAGVNQLSMRILCAKSPSQGAMISPCVLASHFRTGCGGGAVPSEHFNVTERPAGPP